jgi:hypothetical protein
LSFCSSSEPGSPSPRVAQLEAVLAQGLMDASGRVLCPTHHEHRNLIEQDALVWLGSNDVTWAFSFVSLCEQLGYEPSVLRARVYRQRRAKIQVAA